MTDLQLRSVKAEIEKCAKFIEREEKRDENLRPQDATQLLEFYKNHKAKLEGMVA